MSETDSKTAPAEPWSRVRSDELMALHRVALEARDAVEIAAAAGVHLGPLKAALNRTVYKIEDR